MKIKLMQQENNLYRLLSNILLAFLALYMLKDFIGVLQVRWYHNIAVLVGSILYAGFYILQSKARILWGLLVCTFLLICILINGGGETIQLISSYFNWLMNAGNWEMEYVTVYELLNIMLVTFLVLFIQKLGEKELRFKTVFSVLIVCYLLVSMIFNNPIHNIGVVLGITYILITYLEWIRYKWDKKKSVQHSSALLWLLPFMVIYMILLIIVPTPEKPFDWEFAKDIYDHVKKNVIIFVQNIESNFVGKNDFNFAFSGFSEDGALSGNVLDNNREIMQIDTQSSLVTNIYLTGNIFNEFHGNEWILTDRSTELDREIDTLETAYAVHRYDSSNYNNYANFTKLHIKYLYLNTRYIFTPIKYYTMSFMDKKVDLKGDGNTIISAKKNGYGTEYELQLLQMNLGDVGFKEMLKDQYGYEYEQVSSVGEANREILYDLQHHNVIKFQKDTITEAYLNNRRLRIKEVYGRPVVVSQGVRAYLDQVIAGKETPLEKIEAIESALSQMTYTTNPGTIPKGKDFLDYFLLESKEGYCSYFATAFVLLARAEGIPARYVQGFSVQLDKKGKQTISVISDMAHAWPEVYLDGIGWMPYEPTPAYDGIRNTSWKTVDNNVVRLEEEEEPEAFEEMPPIEDELTEVGTVEAKVSLIQVFFIILCSILFILLSVICFLLLDSYLVKRKYEKMSLQGRLRASLMENMNILSLMGYSLQEGETLTEIKRRVRNHMEVEYKEGDNEKYKLPTLRFINQYEEAVYGHREVTNELISSVREEQKEMLDILRQQKGKYWIKLLKLYFMRSRSYNLIEKVYKISTVNNL